MTQGYKLSSPFKFCHFFLAVPIGGVPFPTELFTYRGAKWIDILCPMREEDSGKVEDGGQAFLVRGWSRIEAMKIVEDRGWRFVPLLESQTYHINERLGALSDTSWLPPVKGNKTRLCGLNFAVGRPIFRNDIPYDMLRYCNTVFVSPPSEGDWSQTYFVRPGEKANCSDQYTWWIERWRSFQWLLEPIHFAQLPQELRGKFI